MNIIPRKLGHIDIFQRGDIIQRLWPVGDDSYLLKGSYAYLVIIKKINNRQHFVTIEGKDMCFLRKEDINTYSMWRISDEDDIRWSCDWIRIGYINLD